MFSKAFIGYDRRWVVAEYENKDGLALWSQLLDFDLVNILNPCPRHLSIYNELVRYYLFYSDKDRIRCQLFSLFSFILRFVAVAPKV